MNYMEGMQCFAVGYGIYFMTGFSDIFTSENIVKNSFS
jgi:hypothetical protein